MGYNKVLYADFSKQPKTTQNNPKQPKQANIKIKIKTKIKIKIKIKTKTKISMKMNLVAVAVTFCLLISEEYLSTKSQTFPLIHPASSH